MCYITLNYNTSTWYASSTAFAAAIWPTIAGCFAPHWTHDPHASVRLSVSPYEAALVARLLVALQRDRGPSWCDAFPCL